MVFHYYALLSTLSTELSTFFLIVCVLFVYCLTFYIHLSFHVFAVPAFSDVYKRQTLPGVRSKKLPFFSSVSLLPCSRHWCFLNPWDRSLVFPNRLRCSGQPVHFPVSLITHRPIWYSWQLQVHLVSHRVLQPRSERFRSKCLPRFPVVPYS